MDWLEISIKLSVTDLEKAESIANMSVPYGIYVEDYSDLETGARKIAHIDLIDEELIAKNRNEAIIHIYFAAEDNLIEAKEYLEERLRHENIDFEIFTDCIKESAWKDNWKKYFKCTEIGDKLVICPSWEKYSGDTGRKILTIDPGAAFGTGTHATTRLCLEMLGDYVEDGTMLDIGCGSGILAIGATLLGAEKAIGVDIDETSVKVAIENAELNKVGDRAEFIVGDLTDKINDKYNIVCANIVADVIIDLSKNVRNFMKPNGVFLCSGIIDIRADEVETALINNGFTILQHKTIDNWHAFALK